MEFKVKSNFEPTIDQQRVIDEISSGILAGERFQTLKGKTAVGKTFIMAKVLEKVKRPGIILTHNKTLVAQLYEEFKSFLPENLVEYYVSHFDYYQPESYLPTSGKYIAKDSSINDELQRLRISAASSLTSGRRDVCVVASVSCIFGAGNPKHFKQRTIHIKVGQILTQRKFLFQLTEAMYSRQMNTDQFKLSTFIVKGDTIIINSSNDVNLSYKVSFFGNEIESIETIDFNTGKIISNLNECSIFPASIIVMPDTNLDNILSNIEKDMNLQHDLFISKGLEIEAKRIKERTLLDIEMIRELGYCNGMENYGRYFDGRNPGDRAFCILDYFDDDYVIFIDESHVTLPIIHAMYGGNLSIKRNLIDYGFRLPSAMDNRPLIYDEFINIINQAVFVSATPSKTELELCGGVITELVTRPTGILDPIIEVRPTEHCIDDLIHEIHERIKVNERVLVTTISKKSSESLADYLYKIGIKCRYIHSDIDTIERTQILHDLRSGTLDVIIGINLLREGLDLPEVSLVAILYADKEGFLRDYTSMTQTIGRAARNANGKAIMYANKITGSMQKVIEETDRIRNIQIEFNKLNNISPKTIIKPLNKISIVSPNEIPEIILKEDKIDNMSKSELSKYRQEIEKLMFQASKELDFIEAAKYKKIRDKIDFKLKQI